MTLLFQRCAVSQGEQSEPPNPLDEFRLDCVNPEAFNLFTQWLYGIELPRVQWAWPRIILSLDDGNLNDVPLPAQLQSSGALEPLVEKENANGSAQSKFLHIAFRDPYHQFSAEEIRLADMLRSSITSDSTNPENAEVKTEDTGTPVDAVASTEELNERTQTGLLRLMLLAEMAGWNQCFNDAMENYRHGEILMKRNSLNLDHIDLAYSTIGSARHMPDYSPTLRFMADYAYFKGTECGLLTVYQELFAKFPRFSDDIRLRENDLSTVPGIERRRFDGASVTAFLGPETSPLGIKGRYRAL